MGEGKGVNGAKHTVTNGNWTSGGEHTMECTGDALQGHTPENYMTLSPSPVLPPKILNSNENQTTAHTLTSRTPDRTWGQGGRKEVKTGADERVTVTAREEGDRMWGREERWGESKDGRGKCSNQSARRSRHSTQKGTVMCGGGLVGRGVPDRD